MSSAAKSQEPSIIGLPGAGQAASVGSVVYRFEIKLPVVNLLIVRLHRGLSDFHAGKLVDMERAINEPPPE